MDSLSKEKLDRLHSCVQLLDKAAAAAQVDRMSHVNAQIAVQELTEHLNSLRAPSGEHSKEKAP